MQAIEQHRQNIIRRMIGSSGVFVLFAIVAAGAGVKGTTFEDNTLLTQIVLMLTSLMILPRKTSPRRWPATDTPEQEDRLNMLRDDLRALETRLAYMRFFYLAIAVLLVVAMPLMGI